MRLQSFSGGIVRNRHPFGRQLRRFARCELAWFVDAADSCFQDGGCLMFAVALQAWSERRLQLATLLHPSRGSQAQHVVARFSHPSGDLFLDSDGVGTQADLFAKLETFERRTGWTMDGYDRSRETVIPFEQTHVDRLQASLLRTFGRFEALQASLASFDGLQGDLGRGLQIAPAPAQWWGSDTLRLVTSNPRKLAEFAEFGLPLAMAQSIDLPEVEGTPDEVVLHKALAAGPGTIVEDTILEIAGRPVVDVRWRLGELGEAEGQSAAWIVSLGANDGQSVRIWRGRIEGHLRSPSSIPPGAFGFDPFFVPEEGGGLSLQELASAGVKTRFSARAHAAEALLHEAPLFEHQVADIEPWSGGWQGAHP